MAEATIRFVADQKSMTIFEENLPFLFFEDKTMKVESSLKMHSLKYFFIDGTMKNSINAQLQV